MSAFEGSAWQQEMDAQRERTAKSGISGCGHPGCTVIDSVNREDPRCTLARPLSISIPPGKHHHVECAVHGDHVIRG
jgi:hypothetical protein